MFREMRRKKQLLSNEECVEILKSCSTGILAVNGDDGYPYTVPLNYTYEDGKLSFHCAVEGHKMDAIKRDDKVSFCVIEMDKVVPQTFSTDYRSVVVFGRARVITEDNERRVVLEKLIDKYSAGYEEEGQREIEKDWNRVALVEINIEHMTGKKSSSFV
ncbi:MAG: pyridoxamine 5'-phosphate oxidase family protein [Anaerovoracaceae bacterium]|jgi:nitroimidazol reductase NimA-like FMN-containing flavoprotein (pyridoxamine 5'-phosphate oxidase superfamily)